MIKHKQTKKKRSITKKTLIYTGGTILASISMAGSTFLYSKYTATGDYGNFQLTISIVMLLATVGFLDIRTSTLRFMYGVNAENDEDRNKAIYSGGLILALCSLFLFGTVFIANKITHVPFPVLGLFWGLSYAVANFYLFVTRGFDREFNYSIAYSLYFGALLLLNLYFLAYKHYDAKYILIAMTIAEVIQIIYLEVKIGILRHFRPRFIDRKISAHMIRFSIPLAVTALGTWIMSYYASIQVSKLLGSSSNGIFSMSMEFAKAVPMATGGIILAWQEIAFSRETSGTNKELNKDYFSQSITTFFLIYAAFFMVFIPLMQLIIPYYLSEAFQPVGNILALCTAGFTCDCISQMIASIFGNDIDSTPIMVSTIIGSAFLITTIPTFIRLYQITGASLCVSISFLLTLLIRIVWLGVGKQYKINYLKISLSILVAAAFGYYSTIGSYTTNIILTIVGLAIGLPIIIKLKKNVNEN
jgi:O-antigen/teichoic acid export membrane protein